MDLVTPQAKCLRLSATLEINELVQRRLAQNRDVVHLGFGEATLPIHESVLKAHATASRNTSYLPVAGLKKLRESIAKFQSRRLGFTIRPDQVVVAPGSKPLLFAFFDVLKGDVLLPRPSWVSYEPQVRHAGKRLFWVETDEQDRHNITALSLQASYDQALAEGASPRIMLINSPSNPTGQTSSAAALLGITEFCRAHNITLISDEIYSDLTFHEQDRTTPCAGENFNLGPMILTGGMSKTYSAGGWRIGYAIFPDTTFGTAVLKTTLAYASECWSAASAPAQEAAAVAFDTRPEMDLYRTQVTRLHQYCTAALFKALTDCGLAVAPAKGGFYLYPSFHPYTKQLEVMGIGTSKQLSHWLVEECGIATLPGSAFGEDDEGLMGGRYRLRMATSYLFFRSEEARYTDGYKLIEEALVEDPTVSGRLPLLDRAIEAIEAAVQKIRSSGLS
ncbi:hypothetical protein KC345_g8877 [Hortaea werneckii]|nr:hypothetical protein KC345_g8877 [Hortaea werneckii]